MEGELFFIIQIDSTSAICRFHQNYSYHSYNRAGMLLLTKSQLRI